MNAHQIVEAVLFASDSPITADEIARTDESLDEDQVEQAIRFLQAEYDDAERSFQVAELAEGYQILTRSEFAPYLERFDNVPRPSRLSGPALETLAIIVYRQPLGRIEIEYIRGVGSAGVLKTLQDRELIEVVGRAEGLGRPVLYGTTMRFLEHFGFKSIEDLPRPEELPVLLRDRIPLGPETDEEDDEADGGPDLFSAVEGEAPGADEAPGAGDAPATDEAHTSGDGPAADEATPEESEDGEGATSEIESVDRSDAAWEGSDDYRPLDPDNADDGGDTDAPGEEGEGLEDDPEAPDAPDPDLPPAS